MEWSHLGPRTLPGTDVYNFESEKVGDELQVTVAAPLVPTAPDTPLPTLFVLDPIATSDTVIGVTRALSMLAFGSFPPLLVVAIGYDRDALSTMSLRMRDQTPTEAAPPPLLPSPVAPVHGTGGAGRFLDALRDEVMPHVEAHHGASESDRAFVGWSLGGLFGLHVLLEHPEVFQRYLLVSPAIWWDDFHVVRREEATATARHELDASVYVAVGEREEAATTRTWPPGMSAAAVEAGRMVSGITDLVTRLRSRGTRDLRVELDVLRDEHHATIFPSALSRGLMTLHGPPPAGPRGEAADT